MSNTLTGLTNTLLAWDAGVIQAELNKVLAPVAPKITPLSAFGAYFSNVPSGTGTINVPIPTYPTASQLNAGSGITISNAVVTNAPITLSNDWYQFFGFNPVEVQSAGITNLVNTFIAPAIYAIESTITSASFALALANFSTSSIKATTSAYFSASAVTAINAELSKLGINGDRIMVLNSDYYWNGIINDLSKKNNQAGADAIASGTPNNPFRTTISEGAILSSQFGSATVGSGSFIGFAGTRGGIVVGTAIPQVVHTNGQSLVLQSPVSGMYVLVEQYYNEYLRQHIIGASVVGNVVKGNNCLELLVTA